MNFWFKQKFCYYLIILALRWFLYLSLDNLFSKNWVFCFKKQLLEAITQVEFTFVWKFCTFAFLGSTYKCMRGFYLLHSEDIKKKVKRPGFYVLQKNLFFNFSLKLQNRTENIFLSIARTTHAQNFREK